MGGDTGEPCEGYRWLPGRWPSVLTAGRFFLDDRRFEVPYWHTRRLAIHLHEYAGTVRIGDNEIRLKPGDLTVSPPDVPSCYDLPRPGTHLCLHLAVTERAAGCPALSLPLHLSADVAGDAAALRIGRVIDWHVQSPRQPAASHAAAALAMELLIWLSRPQSIPSQAMPSGGGLRQAVLQAARLIEAKPLAHPGTPELARAVGMSSNYLARGFRQHFGVTIHRFALLRRLQLAKELLDITDLPIKAIAARVGMSDQHHFNKMFRQSMGVSPSAWRGRRKSTRTGG